MAILTTGTIAITVYYLNNGIKKIKKYNNTII